MPSPEVVAIETCATDYHYSPGNVNPSLRAQFINFMDKNRSVRRGQHIILTTDEWETKLIAFGAMHGMDYDKTITHAANAKAIRTRIFGSPTSVEGGGALANAFHTMISAKINGKPITNGVFITAVGNDRPGEIFRRSLDGHIVAPSADAVQTVAHALPIGGDYITVTVNSATNPAPHHMSPEQLDAITIGKDTKLVMLGGFLQRSGKYEAFLNAMLKKVEAVDKDPKKRPTIVLTAASQEIASSGVIYDALKRASKVAPVIMCANTGEFRRLMKMDKEWRKEFKANWWVKDGVRLAESQDRELFDPNSEEGKKHLRESGWEKLRGDAYEQAERAHAGYNEGKLRADMAAFRTAYRGFCASPDTANVIFVITNEKKPMHLINSRGIKSFDFPKTSNTHTIGLDNGFVGGFLLGKVKNLPDDQCVQLGMSCAKNVLEHEGARLPHLEVQKNRLQEADAGLPAYLNSTGDIVDQQLIRQLGKPARKIIY